MTQEELAELKRRAASESVSPQDVLLLIAELRRLQAQVAELEDLLTTTVRQFERCMDDWHIEKERVATLERERDEARSFAGREFSFKYGPDDPARRKLIHQYPWLKVYRGEEKKE